MKLDIYKLDGSKSGLVELPAAVFAAPVRTDVMQRVVVWQRAAKRAGTADTQTRSEVNRSKAKWIKQKGTGRARHGARTPNLFVGGGVSHGPTPRDHSININKKVRLIALRSALSARAGDGKLMVIDEAKLASHKTQLLLAGLKKLSAERALFLVDSLDTNFDKASRNLPHVKVVPTEGVNVYDILRHPTLVLTRTAVDMLFAKLNPEAEKAEKKAAPAKKTAAPKAKSAAKSTAKLEKKPATVAKAAAKKASKKGE